MTAKIEIEDKQNYTLLKLIGDFNSSVENESLLKSFKEIAKSHPKNVLIDLTKVVYLNSGSIGTLLSGNALIKKNDGKVVIFGASDYIKNIFDITKLNLALEIYDSEEDALKAL